MKLWGVVVLRSAMAVSEKNECDLEWIVEENVPTPGGERLGFTPFKSLQSTKHVVRENIFMGLCTAQLP